MKELDFLMLCSASLLGLGLYFGWDAERLQRKTNKTTDVIIEIKCRRIGCIICLVMAVVYAFRIIYLLT